jgi:pimeloyl-ACP methyl ester carboxylesterase
MSDADVSEVRTTDGTNLHVIQVGDPGLPVVLAIHGFASSARANWVVTGWPRALTDAGLRLVAFDLRGHGASAAPRDAAGIGTHARDALEVLDALGIDRAHALGYSLGSRIALEAARLQPARWRSLVLGGVAGTDPTPDRLVTLARDAGVLDGAVRAVALGLGPGGEPPPGPPAGLPALAVVGDADEVAHDAVAWARSRGVPSRTLPGRTHSNAVSARAFKEAAIAVFTGDALGD